MAKRRFTKVVTEVEVEPRIEFGKTLLELDSEGVSAETLAGIPPIAEAMTIPGMYKHRAQVRPNTVVAERRSELGGWRPVSIEEFLAEVEVTARGLIGMGVEKGQSVALLAANSYRWMVLDLAILSVGAVTVPIYESDSVKQIRHILTDAAVVLAIAETTQQADLIESVAPEELREILCLDQGGERVLQSRARLVAPVAVTDVQKEMQIDDLATIIYTSGTTGTPKGVALSHRNFVATTAAVQLELPEIALDPETRILLFLPLAHVLARFVMHGLATGAGRVGFSPDTKNLVSDIASFQPTALLVVPRVLEKVYNAAQAKAGGGVKAKLFGWAAKTARRFGSARETSLDAKRPPSYFLADKLVLQKVRAALGKNLKHVVSGGAPLAGDLAQFFRGLDLDVLQGYGLSESTGPVTVQRPSNTPAGTVGPVLPLNEVKIGADGEVLLRGESVFMGYHNLPLETAESFEDGWFKTGDIGELDQDGQLRITGRKKGIIVTAGGKNVSPEALEERLITHPLIGHVVVVGDAKPYVAALITLDPEMLPLWLSNKGLEVVDPVTALDLPEVQRSLSRAIRRANSAVSRAESIRRFGILNASFTVENGYLTPSLKLRRGKVLRDFQEDIEALYGGRGQNVVPA